MSALQKWAHICSDKGLKTFETPAEPHFPQCSVHPCQCQLIKFSVKLATDADQQQFFSIHSSQCSTSLAGISEALGWAMLCLFKWGGLCFLNPSFLLELRFLQKCQIPKWTSVQRPSPAGDKLMGVTCLNEHNHTCYLHVCMYVWLYVCMYVCMHTWMHACMHTCVYICMYMYTYVYVCVCVYDVWMFMCMSGCVYKGLTVWNKGKVEKGAGNFESFIMLIANYC